MTTVSPYAAAAREAARVASGQFGVQDRTAPADLSDPDARVSVLETDALLFRQAAERIRDLEGAQPPWVSEVGDWLESCQSELRMRASDLHEAQRLALAVLNTPPHGVIQPGVTYAANPHRATYVLPGTSENVTPEDAAARLFEGVEIIRGNDLFIVPGGPVRGVDGDRNSDQYRPPAQIARSIRSDLKAAVAVGWLPDVPYSVRSTSGSINVRVGGISDEDRRDPYKDDPFDDRRRTDRDGILEIERRVEAIRARYGYDRSDSMRDYFDVAYYGTTRIITDAEKDFEASEKARRTRT